MIQPHSNLFTTIRKTAYWDNYTQHLNLVQRLLHEKDYMLGLYEFVAKPMEMD